MLVTENVIRKLGARVREFEWAIALRGSRAELGDAYEVEAEARRLRLQTMELMLTRDDADPFEATCERLDYIAELCELDRLTRLQAIQRELSRGGEPVDRSTLLFAETLDRPDDGAIFWALEEYEWFGGDAGALRLASVIRL